MAATDTRGVWSPVRTARVPFAAALGVSLVLHAGFFYTLPSFPRHTHPTVDAVYIDLPPLATSQEKPPAAPVSENHPAPALQARSPDPQPLPLPSPETEAQARTPTETRPAAEPTVAQAATTPAAEASSPSKNPVPASRDRSRGSAASGGIGESKPLTKALGELMPSSKELAPFRSSGKLPDPAGGTAREVTLGLGDNDARYQGYVDRVRTEIYAGWHMGRGLVVAGGPRRVIIRFSLNSLGMADTPTVTQSSGNPTLDAEAAEAVRRAKIAPFPNHWTVERLFLYAVFDYDFR